MEPQKCKASNCNSKFMPHGWGSARATKAGWFLQYNGDAWCPSHIPEWVANWRPNQKLKGK